MRWMKFILVVFFLSLVFEGVTQEQKEETNQLDKQGQKHGKWIKKYSNGNPVYIGQFNHGEPTGTFKRYYTNGKLQAIMNYKPDQKVYTELYNKNGEKQAEGIYLERKKDSIWKLYDEQGNLVSKDSYSKGVLDGKSLKFYPDGDTSQIIRWEDGEKDGNFKHYFPGGNVKMQGKYEDGELEGFLTIFYPSGYKKVEGQYKNNLREGNWTYYDENGDTTNVIEYTWGVPENQDSLEIKETQELIKLEQNEGKFKDPRDQFYDDMGGRK